MESVQKNLSLLLIAGALQLALLNILFWTGDSAVELLGSRISVLGNKKIAIKPPTGMVFIDHPDSLSRYQMESLAFVIKGDSIHSEKPIIFAEVFIMDNINTLEKMSTYLNEESEQQVVFNRIQGSSLNVILFEGKTISDSSFVYCRYLTAYPYFLRLSSIYEGTMYPPEEVLEVLKSVLLEKR